MGNTCCAAPDAQMNGSDVNAERVYGNNSILS